MRNKKGYALMIIGLCLVALSLGLTAFNHYDENRAGRSAGEALAQIDISEAGQLAQGEIPDYRLNPEMDMPTKTVDGNEYIGVLKIKAIDLELPVISQCDNSKLRVAPCRYSGSIYLNNMIIAGHDYITHLGYMFNLELGDKITFTDVDGNIFRYEVVDMGYLYTNETNKMLEEDGWDLTLFTCIYTGRQRLTVRARLIED